MSSVYLILDSDRLPVLVASNLEMVEKLLGEYVGLGSDNVLYIGFNEYYQKYGGDLYEGYYEYRIDGNIEKFLRYYMCVDTV